MACFRSESILFVSDKLQFRRQRFGIPAAGRLAVDRRNILDRDLPAAGLGTFYLHVDWVAGLLMYLLVGRRFVFDKDFGRRVRFEEQHPRLERDAMIDLVHDGSSESEALQVSCLTIGVSQREDPLAFG